MKQVLSYIENYIKSDTDFSSVIDFARLYATVASANPRSCYAASALESKILEKASQLSIRVGKEEKLPVLFYVTRTYRHGGHTTLINRFAEFLKQSQPHLAIRYGGQNPPGIESVNFYKIIEPNGGSVCSAIDIVSSIANIAAMYRIILIFAHSNDVEGMLALKIAAGATGARLYFVNHNDHVYSFGRSYADVFLEISQSGLQATQGILGIPAKLIGIPINDLSQFDERINLLSGAEDSNPKVCIFSGGSGFKYRPISSQSFPQLICSLLTRRIVNQATIVGPHVISDWWWWWPKIRFWFRLKIRSTLPKAVYLKAMLSHRIYLDSCPYPGGTAFAEALLSGCATFGLSTFFYGYSPAENLKSSTTEDLIDLLLRYCDKDPVIYSKIDDVRELCKRWHSGHSVCRRLLTALDFQEDQKELADFGWLQEKGEPDWQQPGLDRRALGGRALIEILQTVNLPRAFLPKFFWFCLGKARIRDLLVLLLWPVLGTWNYRTGLRR